MAAPRVLYIEDNLENMSLVRRVLRASGFELYEATTALQGIALAVEIIPDVILMDINLPEIDGITATRYLRQIPALHNVPIIAVTANVMHNVLERALKSGCDGVIEKPIDIDEFPGKIQYFVEHRRSQ